MMYRYMNKIIQILQVNNRFSKFFHLYKQMGLSEEHMYDVTTVYYSQGWWCILVLPLWLHGVHRCPTCVCVTERVVCVRGGERCLLDLLPHSVIFFFCGLMHVRICQTSIYLSNIPCLLRYAFYPHMATWLVNHHRGSIL